MSASLPFDKKPPARGERLPVADKLRTDRGKAETLTRNVPLGHFSIFLRFRRCFKVKGKVASGGLRNFLKKVS